MKRREFLFNAAAFATALSTPISAFAEARRAVCYNCPPEWADWGAQLQNMKKVLGIEVPPDNKNAGQSLAALVAERASPVADIAYAGGNFAQTWIDNGIPAQYEPKDWVKVPENLKDTEGRWFAVHKGTIGFFVNTSALGGAPVPRSWKDLTKANYANMIGYLDPTSSPAGQLCVLSANLALGGSYDNLSPGIELFQRLKKNGALAPKQTAYARVLSGELPILLDYDFNAYRAIHKDNAPVEFVIPQEGTQNMPHIMCLVKGGPNPANGKAVLDYILSDEGQLRWAESYVAPIRNIELPKEVKNRFLPASDYARTTDVDLRKFASISKTLIELYRKEVG